MSNTNKRYKQAKKVTLIGALVNALLGIVKLIGGIAFHSHALIADAIHSFADLITDTMVLFASKYGSQDPDVTHPYGHKRIETAATLMLALLLILAGFGIAWDSIEEIIHHSYHEPGLLALPIAVLSIMANEILFHYTKYIGQQINSAIIIANAWHHRSDAGASIVVLIGLIGSVLGIYWFDALAALIVGGLIIHMGLSYGWNSVKELIDTSVEPNMLINIERIIENVGGVLKIHQLRTRLMGGDIYVDVHILVQPTISVSEGHFIAQHVHQALLSQMPLIKDVTVHVDPEDDERCSPSYNLPTRETLELEFLQKWQKNYPEIRKWDLHYLNGTLSIDLICSKNIETDHHIHQQIDMDLTQYQTIITVRLLWTLDKDLSC